MKNLIITLEKARELYKEGGSDIRELLLVARNILARGVRWAY
jgi:hypothetical protein